MADKMELICVRLDPHTIERLDATAQRDEKFMLEHPVMHPNAPLTRSETIRQAILSGLDIINGL